MADWVNQHLVGRLVRHSRALRSIKNAEYEDVALVYKGLLLRANGYRNQCLGRDLLHDEPMDGHDPVMNRYLKPDLLIIDDFGMKQLPKRSGEFLFEIVMRRYETRSTMMTTNRPLEDWGKLLGDVPTVTAILARLLHHAEILTFGGKLFRLRSRQADSKPAKAPTGSAAE